MAMTDEEILRAAGRVRAARRRRLRKTCAVCGTPFEGIAQRRYCSDACRVRAARQRLSNQAPRTSNHRAAGTALEGEREPWPAPRGADESIADYFDRVRAVVVGAERVGRVVDRPAPSTRATAAFDGAGAEPPRGEHESLSDYFERIGRAMTGHLHPREWEDWEDSTELIRQMREERTTALLRASGMFEDEGDPPAPRGEDEPLLDYLTRVTAYVMGDQVFDDDSAKLVRQGRQERTAELLSAIESARTGR